MPKDTFYNLPEDKRFLIEDIATHEFVEYGYDKASVNRIVKNCKIAKGSFYQYFEDKKDLFKHLLKRLTDKKLKYISPKLQNPYKLDFFVLLREMYISGLRFGAENSAAAYLGNQILKNKDHPVYKEAVADTIKYAYSFIESMLNNSIKQGNVRANIDTKFVSYIITALNIATIEYYFDVVKNTEMVISDYDGDIMETVDLFIDFIKNGIGKQTGGKSDD
ncbi:TetR/AcrR family transcriptional regulator [Clostridium sp. 'deep sea']|uniref:TetR/AcrR family transcriptional regulator n=1 Tax=Clostridium sp. 'deep sea' TaxID=2779445 RepID=UPI0018964CC9|nr:TetR/AcrR family transcriptional regulator [Clostridium sp. 'deep sea']QOR35024.1 TetR/AcrR family transcriptional regulator [Clostridium sp. 'deep sea']